MTKLERATAWMKENIPIYDYGDPLDLAIDCAYDLDMCEWCEINGDKTFIPTWMTDLAEELMPE